MRCMDTWLSVIYSGFAAFIGTAIGVIIGSAVQHKLTIHIEHNNAVWREYVRCTNKLHKLIITGSIKHSPKDVSELCPELNNQMYVSKPFITDCLAAVVESILAIENFNSKIIDDVEKGYRHAVICMKSKHTVIGNMENI